MSDLRERIAGALGVWANGFAWEYQAEVDRVEFLSGADAVLDALGLEQVGWWVGPWEGEDERLSFHDPGFQHEREPVYRLGGSHE